MIRSFGCKDTQAIFERIGVKRFRNIEKAAYRRLVRLDASMSLRDLGAVRGNHLEALTDDRKGQHSIRINDQCRICFSWGEQGSENVEIVDYH